MIYAEADNYLDILAKNAQPTADNAMYALLIKTT